MTQYDPQARLLLWARALREGKDMHRIRAGAVTVEELAKALGEASAALERADKLQVTYNVPASIPRKRGEAQWKRESRGRFTGR